MIKSQDYFWCYSCCNGVHTLSFKMKENLTKGVISLFYRQTPKIMQLQTQRPKSRCRPAGRVVTGGGDGGGVGLGRALKSWSPNGTACRLLAVFFFFFFERVGLAAKREIWGTMGGWGCWFTGWGALWTTSNCYQSLWQQADQQRRFKVTDDRRRQQRVRVRKAKEDDVPTGPWLTPPPFNSSPPPPPPYVPQHQCARMLFIGETHVHFFERVFTDVWCCRVEKGSSLFFLFSSRF